MDGTDEEPDRAGNPQSAQSVSSQTTTRQFKLAALFWVTFTIGVGLAYLQRLDSPDIVIGGVLSLVIGVVVGGAVGLVTGRLHDGLFWGTLIAAFGYISVASDPIYLPNQRLAWAAVGAITGALSSTVATGQSLTSVSLAALVSGAAGGLVMWAYAAVATRMPFDLKFDLFAAPLIGVLVALFIQALLWLESQHRMPRYVTATWLLIVVIIGNWFAI